MVVKTISKTWFLTLAALFILSSVLASFVYAKPSVSSGRFLTDQKVFSLISGDIDGDDRNEHILGSVNGRVYVLNLDGDILWSIDVKGLPFSMCLADINGDGKRELLVASLDGKGTLYAIEYLKGILWTFNAEQPFLSIAAGDMDGDRRYDIALGSFQGQLYLLDNLGRLKIKKSLSRESSITALAFGDIDGNKGDELVVGTSTDGVYALNSSLNTVWSIGLDSTGYKMFWVRSVLVRDINRDGGNEVVIGSRPSGLVTATNGAGKVLWQRNFPEIVNPWSIAQVKAGNITGDDKNEILCLLQGVALKAAEGRTPLVILDSRGNKLDELLYNTSFFSIDLIRIAKGYDEIVLSSSVDSGGIFKFTYNERAGIKGFQEIYTEAMALINLVRASKGASEETGKIHILYRLNYKKIHKGNPKKLEKYVQFIRSSGGGNLSFEVVLTGVYEDKAGLSAKYRRKDISAENEILKVVRQYRENKLPFYVNIGKHGHLFFSLETIEKILAEGGIYCLGFIVDENNFTRTENWEKFIENIEKVLNILSRYEGKKLIMNEYLDFWHKVPLDTYVFKKLFKPAYKDILVPVYKPNNLKSPELNIGVLLGLWKAGAIGQWGVGAYGDMWKWESSFMSAPGHVILRFLVMAESLGANYFVVAKNLGIGGRAGESEGTYDKYLNLFYKLISNARVTPVKNPEDVLISGVALQEKNNIEEKTKREKGNKEYWQSIYTLKGSLVPGFFLQAVRDDYIPAYLYNLVNYYDGLFPKTPYGFVAIFPAAVDPLKVEGIKDYFVIEGDRVFERNGKEIPAGQQKEAIYAHLKGHGEALPFKADGVFLSTHKTDNGYRIYLINPGHFETKEVKTELRINLPGDDFKIIDALSGEVLPLKDKKVGLSVPAGLFRILSVSPKE